MEPISMNSAILVFPVPETPLNQLLEIDKGSKTPVTTNNTGLAPAINAGSSV